MKILIDNVLKKPQQKLQLKLVMKITVELLTLLQMDNGLLKFSVPFLDQQDRLKLSMDFFMIYFQKPRQSFLLKMFLLLEMMLDSQLKYMLQDNQVLKQLNFIWKKKMYTLQMENNKLIIVKLVNVGYVTIQLNVWLKLKTKILVVSNILKEFNKCMYVLIDQQVNVNMI